MKQTVQTVQTVQQTEHSSVIVQCNYLHGLSILSINISTFLEPVIFHP